MVRGFKTRAKAKSIEIRDRLGIKLNEPINCFDLINSLNIPVLPVEKLGEFGLTTEEIYTICYSNNKQQFSAMTIAVNFGHIIIYNQSHSVARTNSSLAHEVSHIILEHKFSLISDIKNISREFDNEKEDEANWLAGCLLLPEESLIWALKKKMSISEIANHFNISQDMAQWRYNSTGMKRRMKYIK